MVYDSSTALVLPFRAVRKFKKIYFLKIDWKIQHKTRPGAIKVSGFFSIKMEKQPWIIIAVINSKVAFFMTTF